MSKGPSGKGSSASKNTSTSSTNNTTVVTTDNRVYQSDFGAVEAGTNVARDAITSNERVTGDAISAMSDVSSDAISLGRDALDSANDNLNLGLGFALDTYESSLVFGEKAIDAVSENARDFSDALANQNESLISQTISGLQSLAKTTSESADDRVTRLGVWAFGAIAAIMILPAIFGKAR